jgi:hypothetical protein
MLEFSMPSTRFTVVLTRAVAALAIGAALVLAPASAAAASVSASVSADPAVTLYGCTGTLQAQPKGGGSGTKVTAPTAKPASKSDPIVVNWDDKMVYSGTSSGPITDYRWTASIAGIPVASGSSANATRETTATGSVEVGKALPLKLTGLYYVSFELKGTGGACTGNAWLKLDGNPLTTIPFWIGVVVALGGLLGLSRSRPRVRADGSTDLHFVGGFLAGLLLGLGLLIALTVSSLAAFSQWWPYAAILGGATFLGLLTGTVGPKRGLVTAPVAAPPPALPTQTGVPDAGEAGGLLCDGRTPDSGIPEAGEARGLLCDGRTPDSGMPEAGEAGGLLCDGRTTDSGIPDAGEAGGLLCDGRTAAADSTSESQQAIDVDLERGPSGG